MAGMGQSGVDDHSPLKVQKSPFESDGRFHSAGKLCGILILLFTKQTLLFCLCVFTLKSEA